MSRFDWDRLRRTRCLDGTDARIDADGTVLWEKPKDGALLPLGSRGVRFGVFVRRRRDAAAADGGGGHAPSNEPRPIVPRPELARCAQCGALVSRRKRLRHSRRCVAKEGARALDEGRS